jgi:hypothetical protein
MRLYPDTADDRGRAVAKDALVLLTLFVLAWLALKVHDAVDQLAVLGTGVRESGEVAQAGSDGEEKVHDLANLLGVLFFAIPASILLIATLPSRIRQFRELNAAARLLDVSSEERRRLVAMRAAYSLPARELARHTKDPLGDWPPCATTP